MDPNQTGFPWKTGDVVVVVHSCEPPSSSLLTRFKQGFFKVATEPDPDSPRWKVKVPKPNSTTEEVWRCNVKHCDKCKQTAGSFADLTLTVAISHGITGVPVKDPHSGEVLGRLASGSSPQHLSTPPSRKAAILASSPGTKMESPKQKATGGRGPAGDVNKLRQIYQNGKQISSPSRNPASSPMQVASSSPMAGRVSKRHDNNGRPGLSPRGSANPAPGTRAQPVAMNNSSVASQVAELTGNPVGTSVVQQPRTRASGKSTGTLHEETEEARLARAAREIAWVNTWPLADEDDDI